MNYVKDDMCKNLFWVGILWKSEIEANSGLGKGKSRLKYKTMKKKHELIHLHVLIGESWVFLGVAETIVG